VGSIGWLCSSTHPDLLAAHSLLSSYSNKQSVGQMKVALYALHYIHSTHDYGISFTSDALGPMHSYIHFPPSSDTKVYTGAIPPKLLSTNPSTLSTYADACWGSQIGNAAAKGTLLSLFKFRSMSGGILFCNGGPLGWLGKRQNCTLLGSCKAEIHATSATSKKVMDFCHLCCNMAESRHALDNLAGATTLYNDNKTCIKWSYNMTTKGTHHIELQENLVQEWVEDKLFL
jgi:hypothetical protein